MSETKTWGSAPFWGLGYDPDPEQRLPRELLKELIEEGSDAFRGVLEKLLNTAMQMEREEFLGARRWERSEQRRDHANGYKAKTLSTRVGQLQIRIPQVRHLDFYPRSLERGCRSEKALKLAIAEMYVMGVSTRKVTEITEQLCGTEISASQVSRISNLELGCLLGRIFRHVGVLGPLPVGVFDPDVVVLARIPTRTVYLFAEAIDNEANVPGGGRYNLVWPTPTRATHVDPAYRLMILVIVGDFDGSPVFVWNSIDTLRLRLRSGVGHETESDHACH